MRSGCLVVVDFGGASAKTKERRRAVSNMYYVYVIQSVNTPEHFYTGITANLDKRLEEHNSGKSIHTNKFKPWKIRTYITFDNKERAEKFETYLKTSSGRAFMTKRF